MNKNAKEIKISEVIESLRELETAFDLFRTREVDPDQTTLSAFKIYQEAISVLDGPHPGIQDMIKFLEKFEAIQYKGNNPLLRVHFMDERNQPKESLPEPTDIPAEEERIPVSPGYREIRGIKGIPDGVYMMSERGTVVDRRSTDTTSRVVRTERDDKTDIVYYRFPNGKNSVIRVEQTYLLSYIWGDLQSIKTEAKRYKEPDTAPVWIDWIEGIPKRKYRVYPSGEIENTFTDEKLHPSGSPLKVVLNAASSGSGFARYDGRSYRYQVYVSNLVWKAFHTSDRKRDRLRIKYRDGNSKNCSIGNLTI